MRNSPAYGDAFLVNTPAIDRVGAMMINDERQRQLAQQREAQSLDHEFAKNAAAIRDADVPKYSKLFADYKTRKIDLYRNGNRMSNDQRIAKEGEAQRALGILFNYADRSKAGKEEEEDYYKNYRKNPDKYEDIAPKFLAARRKTATDDLETTGLQDIGGNINLKTTDFSNAITSAMGKLSKRNEYQEVINNGLSTQPYKVEAYNSPREYATMLGLKVYTGKMQKYLLNQFQYSDQKANEIAQRYSELTQTPAFKKAYPNEQPFTPEEMADPLKRNINLMAMEHILLHPPTITAGKEYLNPVANKIADQNFKREQAKTKFSEWLTKNGITNSQKNERVNQLMKKGYDLSNPLDKLDAVEPIKVPTNNYKPNAFGVLEAGEPDLFVPFGKNISSDELEDIKKDLPIAQYEGQIGLYKDAKTGEYLDGTKRPIDRNRPQINKFKRINSFMGAETKGKINTNAVPSPTGNKSTKGKFDNL